ncbi:MAG: response regulator [Lachnospiraceae bacterium]
MSSTQNYSYVVVEDEGLIRRNLIKKITSLNLPLILSGEASNGMEAIILVEKNCPDLVITDIRMPQCDGLELSRYLHKNHPTVKIVILSGYNDFSYAQSAISYAVKDYLLKPIDINTLSLSLQKLLITMETETTQRNTYHTNNTNLDQKSIYELMEKYLKKNYQSDISFQELSEKFGFTPEYLGKIFKKHAGETPLKYLTKIRMNEAKRLLLSSPDMEIQKIGELVGYQDRFYFSRLFKSYVGIQPSEFRNRKEE